MSEHRHRIHLCMWMVALTVAYLTLAIVDPSAARSGAALYPVGLIGLWAADRTIARR